MTLPAGYVLYSIICDETNNTDESKADGRINVDLTFGPGLLGDDNIDYTLVYNEVVAKIKERLSNTTDSATLTFKGK